MFTLQDTFTLAGWWKKLSPQWKQAFGGSILLHGGEPGFAELEMLHAMKVLRLAGPEAPFSNCAVTLTDLSGLEALDKLETVIITHHLVEKIDPVARLTNLKSLFLFNNHITSLSGIEGLASLEQLYVQCNRIESIKELKLLLNLREVYVSDNNISSLDGLTEAHAAHLRKFVCLPNERLKPKEIIHAERELGIICR